MDSRGTLLLSRADIAALLTLKDCIPAVEEAFRSYTEGRSLATGLLHIDAPSGEFHIKAGGLKLNRTYFALKVNGGFFQNKLRYGLPNIQGTISLCDGDNGSPLALMDSIEITIKRTGATTAVAAKHLARPDSKTAVICGCGNQGRIQLRGLAEVLPIRRVFAFDQDGEQSERFAREMAAELGVSAAAARDLREALAEADVCVTCTPSRAPFIHKDDVPRGMFIAAVGADSPDKQELDAALLASAKVVVDILDQCINVGELHHAIRAGLLTRDGVHAELGEIVTGRKPGRTSPDEITVFDTTGTALQDTAAGVVVYEKAIQAGRGTWFRFA